MITGGISGNDRSLPDASPPDPNFKPARAFLQPFDPGVPAVPEQADQDADEDEAKR